MKFRFRNIGPVKEADLQLGDLTIIAGRNNTGKTYLAYTLYGFLKLWDAWGSSRYTRRSRHRATRDESQTLTSEIDSLVRRSLDDGRAAIPFDLTKISLLRKRTMRDLSRDFSSRTLAQVFSSSRSAFSKSSIAVEVADTFPQSPDPLEWIGDHGELLTLEYDGANVVLSLKLTDGDFGQTSDRVQHQIITDSVLDVLHSRFLFPELTIDPFVLSAERFGISLFYRELDFTKNQLVDVLQRMGDDRDRDRFSPFFLIDKATSRYALPIKDNIDYTRSIPDLVKGRSAMYEEKYFDDIKHMMGGYYKISGSERMFISKARGAKRFEIPLHVSSSSARGLSDLYFFLRHRAKQNQILIIDEPESHLDTANQIELARLLARLVKAGIKILITTHSDYLVKEINNLIMLSSDFDDKEHVMNKLKYDPDHSISGHLVRAYVAEDGDLRECHVDEFGISMPVFDETINNINTAANEISSRLYGADQIED